MHAAPLSINLVHNAMLRSYVGSNYSISVINKPLPFTFESRMLLLGDLNNIGFQLATNMSFAMAFVSALYIMFYIKVTTFLYIWKSGKTIKVEKSIRFIYS